MSKSQWNIVIDSVAFLAMIFLAATGSVMKFILPPGTGHSRTLWGIDRHEWGDIHAWIAFVLITTIAAHVYLHWGWVVAVIKGRDPQRTKQRTAMVIVALLIIGMLAIMPLIGPVVESGDSPHKQQQHRESQESANVSDTKTQFDIDGTMTFSEIERRTGVPAAYIIQELGLPADLPTNERLGRLRKQHNFQVHDIQPILQKYQASPPLPNDAQH